MHTAQQLKDETFAISIGGRPAYDVFDLFPDFDASDRLGVVVTAPHGALGASLLYLGAVHAFYELQRSKSDDFWIYPDFFLFHVGRRYGHHGSLDVWPEHKEVDVPAEPDRILEAINDRAVTRLVVPDEPSSSSPSGREALASYRSRLRGAYAYSPRGSVAGADIVIKGDEATEGWVLDALEPERMVKHLGPGEEADVVSAHIHEVSPETRAAIVHDRGGLIEEGRPRETYRRIAPDEALERLTCRSGLLEETAEGR